MAAEVRPYNFEADETHSCHEDRGIFFYPRSVENACWDSFLRMALKSAPSENPDIEYVPMKERCEHLREPYPTDGVLVKMRLVNLEKHCVSLLFEHHPLSQSGGEPCVRSERSMACVRHFRTRSLPTEWPDPVRDQLRVLERGGQGIKSPLIGRLLARLRGIFSP